MPLNRSLEVYYLKNLYYDVYLIPWGVEKLLESIGENLELLKLIRILTIEVRNGHETDIIGYQIRPAIFGLLFSSASGVEELNLIGGFKKNGWSGLQVSIAVRTLLVNRFRNSMPLLSHLSLAGGYDLPLVRILDFIEFHPLLKSLHLQVNLVQDLFEDSLPAFVGVETVTLQSSHLDETCKTENFLSGFVKLETLSLIAEEVCIMLGPLTSPDFGEILGVALDRGVGKVKYLKFGLSSEIADEDYRYAPFLYESLRESLSEFRCLKTLEINFPLGKEKVYEMILEDLPQLEDLVIDWQISITYTGLEEFVGQLEAQGRRFTIELEQLKFENPGKRGWSYDLTLEELYDQGRGEEVEELRENLCWDLKIDNSWKRSEPDFDGLKLSAVKEILRIDRESQLVDIVTENLVEAVEIEEAYQKELEFCKRLAIPAVRFPVSAVQYYEGRIFLLDQEESEEECFEGKIGRIELQDEPYRLALEQLLNVEVGTRLYLKPAGWNRSINTEHEESRRLAQKIQAGVETVEATLDHVKARQCNQILYSQGLEAIKVVCEEFGKNRNWKVEVEILEYVVEFTRLDDDDEEDDRNEEDM